MIPTGSVTVVDKKDHNMSTFSAFPCNYIHILFKV